MMTPSDYIIVQTILMIILVSATIFYAYQAKKASDSATTSADASMKMAEEMRLQRLAARPVVIPDMDVHNQDNMRDLAQSYFPVVLTNVGTAAAIELELSLKIPTDNIISTKLPLLLEGANWRTKLTYVADFTEEGEPIFGMPPPEGLYELKATFKSVTSPPNAQFSEVALPFDLHYSGKSFWWKIERHELYQKLEE